MISTRERHSSVANPESEKVARRVRSYDWPSIGTELDGYGAAVLPNLIPHRQCAALAKLYDQDKLFRSRVVMARHGFGRGEYQYFAYPLPTLVGALRAALYPPLAVIANSWRKPLKIETAFPDTLEAWLQRCHRIGQTRPTPLLLKYEAGDYNALHQDVYGETV